MKAEGSNSINSISSANPIIKRLALDWNPLWFFVCLLVFVTLVRPSAAAYETVISDASFTSSSRVIIDEQQIRNSQAPSVSSLLASQANISISSTAFLPNSIYLRGGDPSHILFLVDGVPYYDASTSQRTINLNSIDIRSVRRIEVLRGSQSVLYGGQALTGVVKIETFPLKLQQRTTGLVQGGSSNFQDLHIGTMGTYSDSSAIAVRAATTGKNARSPVLDSDYRYPMRSNMGEISYLNRDTNEYILKFNHSNYRNSISGSDPTYSNYAAVDTVDYRDTGSFWSGQFVFRGTEIQWKPKFYLSFLNSARAYTQSALDARAANDTDEQYAGRTVNSRLDLTPILNQNLRLDLGIMATGESMVIRSLGTETNNSWQELYGTFVKLDYFASQDLTVSIGERLDIYSQTHTANTAQLGLNWKELTKFEIASGFKPPSIAQLTGSYGNANLKPETSLTYSLTQEFPLTKDSGLSATLFETDFNDLIVTSGTPRRYTNLARSQTRGIESAFTQRWTELGSLLSLSIGYQEPYDITNARWLVRRPLQTASAKFSQNFSQDNLTVECNFTGEKLDQVSSSRTATLSSYTLVNLAYTHSLLKDETELNLFSRLSNIGNQRYEESYGYVNEGFSGVVGLEFLN